MGRDACGKNLCVPQVQNFPLASSLATKFQMRRCYMRFLWLPCPS